MPVLQKKNSRFPILLFFILTIFLINSIRSVKELEKSKGKIAQVNTEIEQLNTENKKIKQQIAYAQTPEYLEKAALEKLNKVKPGYKVIAVNLKDGENIYSLTAQKDTSTKPAPIPTWKLWAMEFGITENKGDKVGMPSE